jgi:hypothetical protein
MSLTDAQEIDQLKSRNAISELFADYAHGCDKRQSPDRFLAIWHDDAKYLLGEPMGDRFGIEEIRQALKDIWAASRRLVEDRRL